MLASVLLTARDRILNGPFRDSYEQLEDAYRRLLSFPQHRANSLKLKEEGGKTVARHKGQPGVLRVRFH